jgi:hypothetical protein
MQTMESLGHGGAHSKIAKVSTNPRTNVSMNRVHVLHGVFCLQETKLGTGVVSFGVL